MESCLLIDAQNCRVLEFYILRIVEIKMQLDIRATVALHEPAFQLGWTFRISSNGLLFPSSCQPLLPLSD